MSGLDRSGTDRWRLLRAAGLLLAIEVGFVVAGFLLWAALRTFGFFQ